MVILQWPWIGQNIPMIQTNLESLLGKLEITSLVLCPGGKNPPGHDGILNVTLVSHSKLDIELFLTYLLYA